jgi:hypothetical protein
MVKTQGVTNAPYTDFHHSSTSIKPPVSPRDAIFLEQWSTFTKASFGSLKQGLNTAFAIKDDKTKKSKSKSTPLTPEQKPAILLPSPIIVLRRELPDHHGNQSSLKEAPIFARDPFAAGSPSHPIESEYFSPSGSPDLEGTPKAAYPAKPTALPSSKPKTGPNFITFPNNLGDPSDPDGVHPQQVYLGHPEHGTVAGNQTKNWDLSASGRGIKPGLHIIPSLSTILASTVVNPALLSPRPQYGRKISEPNVPSRDNLAHVVTRSRSNTTASDQLFTGNNGTFFVEPPRPVIKAPHNGAAQSSVEIPGMESSLPLWRRRAASKLARTGKASLAQGPKMILVPGNSGFDDEDAYDLQYTMKVSYKTIQTDRQLTPSSRLTLMGPSSLKKRLLLQFDRILLVTTTISVNLLRMMDWRPPRPAILLEDVLLR